LKKHRAQVLVASALSALAGLAGLALAAPLEPAPPASQPAPGAVPSSSPKAGAAPASPVAATPKAPPQSAAPAAAAATSLEQTRLTLSKWIETQQIISKERNDWQQAKEILQGRIELVGKEVGQLKERIAQSETAVADSNRKRDALVAQNAQLKETGAQLAAAVTAMEAQVQKLAKLAPEGVGTKLAPLLQRIPADPATARISTAERFQNVLGILNELNKANSEIAVAYEVRKMPDGTSSEVQVIYVGLAQAYYLSPRGEAGVGKPTESGWTWRPAPDQAGAIATALEIIKGKEPPAFVPLPVSIQ
jgi:FtsZ-binding cell division protein ZapB